MNVPKLRFLNFNNDYEIKEISDITYNVSSGKISKQLEDGEYNVYGSMGIIGKSSFYDYTGEKVLVARVGANAGSVNKINEKCCISDNTLVLEPKNILNDYLYYSLSHYDPKKLIFGSGQPLVTGGQLKKIKLGVPTKEEQVKVSNFLSLLDKKIELQTKKIEDLKLFTKKVILDILNNEQDVKTKTFKEVCTIQTGKSNTQDKDDNGLYPFYIRSENIERSSKYIFDCEAVITIGDGNIGKVFFYENGKFDCHQRVYVLNNFKDVTGKYLYYYFSTFFYRRAISMSAKNTVDSVRMEMISDMIINYPNITEQNRITTLFDKLEQKQKLEKEKLNTFQNLKKGLMQSMFV